MVSSIDLRQGRQDTTVCLATRELRGVEMFCNAHWQPYGCWDKKVIVVPVNNRGLFRALQDILK